MHVVEHYVACPIKGQVYKECGSACPPTCGDPNPNCFLQCQAGCICPTGTVLDTTKNVCVPLAKCTPSNLSILKVHMLLFVEHYVACPIKGQVYKECGSACPPTCGNPNPTGTVLDTTKNVCVPLAKCTPSNLSILKVHMLLFVEHYVACPIKGQVYKECGSACPPTCGNPNPICTLQCQAGCMCPTGTVLDTTKNVCVSQAKCTCPPTCSRDYCRKNPKSVCTK